jgi:hypothetical protein
MHWIFGVGIPKTLPPPPCTNIFDGCGFGATRLVLFSSDMNNYLDRKYPVIYLASSVGFITWSF